jgi:DNA gyrase/topoisomerase IV subunit B
VANAVSEYSAKQIQALTATQHVRLRPQMYIGSTEQPFHLFREVLDNACDEHLNGNGSNIYIELADDESWVAVTDQGRGIPVDNMADGQPAVNVIFLQAFSGGKFDKTSGYSGASSGLHGIGLTACGVLCERVEVDINKDGYQWSAVYGAGRVIKELTKGAKTNETGTRILIKADPEIFDDIKFAAKAIEIRILDLSFLLPKCHFHFTHKGNTTVYRSNGLGDLLADKFEAHSSGKKNVEKIGEVTYITGNAGKNEVDFAFLFTNAENFHVFSFCNTIRTLDGGTHEAAIKRVFFKLLQAWPDADKYEYTTEELQNGVWFAIHLKLADEAAFTSQTKEKLAYKNSLQVITEALEAPIQLWIKNNPETIKTVFQLAQQRYLARRQSSRLQELASKIQSNLGKKLKRGNIEGLRDCKTTDIARSELFILEGESAAGSATRARNIDTQAILPMQGKVINSFRNAMTSVLANAEIKLLLNTIGCGFGSLGKNGNCDPTLSRYGKILILTDPDPDGAHISSLLISFFLVYLKPLVDSGMVYLIKAPLFSAVKGKERIYAFTKTELDEKINGASGYNITRFKGWGECDPHILKDIAMNEDTRESFLLQVTENTMADAEGLMGGDSRIRKLLIQGD